MENDRPFRQIAVIGAGTMGWQISALAAASGYPVRLFDQFPEAMDRALSHIADDLPEVIATVNRAPWHGQDLADLTNRLTTVGSLEAAVSDADLVIEAVREDLEIKRAVFRQLDTLAPDAVLATNSSSLPSGLLAPVVSDPSRLLNLHFFSPIWDKPMLEVMGCGQTSPEVMVQGMEFGRSLNLATAEVRGQSKGFIINRVWRAIKRESLRVVDEGHADPEDVDRLFMLFFGNNFGPFGMMDVVGLDVVADIEASYAAVSPDPTDRVSPTLQRLIAEGRRGEKDGRGFYRYPNPSYQDPDFLTSGGEAVSTSRDT